MPVSATAMRAKPSDCLRLRLTSPPEGVSGRPEPKRLSHGKLELDLDRFQALWDGREVVLTVTEFGILQTLLGYPGKVYSRDELMDGAYREHNIVTDRTIDSHVRRVRRKFSELGADPIETVHGVGYKIADCQ